MSKKILKSPEDFLSEDPYRSIINVLEIAPTFRKSFKYGLKPRQIMHLLVNGYEINDNSKRILDNFRVYLKNDEQVKNRVILNQKIGGKNPQQNFNKLLIKLNEIGWIQKGEKSKYFLSDRYRVESLRTWSRDIIMGCPANKIIEYNNSTLFHPDITFTEREKFEIEGFLGEISITFINFCRTFGLNKAGMEWFTFINKNDIPNDVKLYFFFKTIYIHYLASLRPKGIIDRKNYSFPKDEITPVTTETLMILRSNKFEGFPEKLFKIEISDIIPDWQNRFLQLLESIVKSKYTQFTIDRTIGYIEEYRNMLEKTFMIRIRSEYMLLLLRPQILSYFYMTNVEKIDKEKARNISRASIDYKKHNQDLYEPFISPEMEKMERIEMLQNTFREFDNDIKQLGFKGYKELCEELLPLAIAF